MSANLEYDYVIIGSGFGGSVSALRLTQKGYKVAVVEAGKRYTSKDFPNTNWSVRKFLWMPKLFCYGIQRINLLRDVMILSGAGVGGGSLVYANTLYVPPKKFFSALRVKHLEKIRQLLPFYELAKKMLGVTTNPRLWPADTYLRETAGDFGKADTFVPTPVGIYFGEKDEKTDPYFLGEGPERHSCNFCGGCMVGCRYEAKNTLDRNYLYFAEKGGAEILPETKVVDVNPLSEDGSAGYEISTRSTTGLFGLPHKKIRTKAVIFSAGVLGTLGLLLKMKQNHRLPRISDFLGQEVRTNSESILGIITKNSRVDHSQGIAITSSVHPDEHTHIEPVRYSKGSDLMGLLATLLTDGGGKVPRQLRFLWNIVKSPVGFLRFLIPIGFAKRGVILLVMQTVDNYIHIVRKRRWIWPFVKSLTSANDSNKIPSYIPIANDFARKMAKRMNAYPGSSLNEVLLDVPTTAHILGGCIMSDTPADGVIDYHNRVFGYENMLVCDGSMIPANLGVNPSLSITAFAERAMSFIPAKEGRTITGLKVEKKWKVGSLLHPSIAKRAVSSKKKPVLARKRKA